MSEIPPIQCPVHESPQPDLAAFAPLLARLQDGTPVVTDETFPRGTLRADGRLDLCKQDAGVTGCHAVTQALQDSGVVQSLLLGTNGIGDEGAQYVADLVRMQPLRTVYLGCNLIGPSGTRALADALRVQPDVRALWLKRNPIGREGARILAGLLRETTALRTLDVVHTGIGDDGARALLQAISEGRTSLQYLYLSGNALTPAILPDLGAVLARQDGLHGLYLSVNALGDEGAVGIAEALQRNTTLTALGLASCGIGDEGLAALIDAAAVHPALVSLDLGDAPSARALGADRNTAGPKTHAAALRLVGAPGPWRALHLPRLPDAASLLSHLPPDRVVTVTGAPAPHPRVRPHLHEDAADVRSVYR